MLSDTIRAEYRAHIDENLELNRRGALALRENIERSDLHFRDYISKALQIPNIYTEETRKRFEEIVAVTYGICVKVIEEYRKNEAYRALFGFSKEAEELILLETGYPCPLPLARFDIFYHEDTGEFWFCEFNTDGSTGMNESRLQDAFMIHNPAHQEMRRRYRLEMMELMDSWVQAFLDVYRTYERCVERPNIAIIDFLDRGNLREFEEFARRFQKAGADCEICDIRELTFHDGRLYSPSGHTVDAVYRRAVTSDILESSDKVQPFLDAVRSQACFVAGSFCTQVVHHKNLFHVLHLPQTQAILSPQEQAFVKAHVPWTVPFSPEGVERSVVESEKDRFILKPEDSYGSKGVHAGVDYHQREWERIVQDTYGNGYICQTYCPQCLSDNIDFAWGDGKWHPFIEMPGLYCYNGKFAGVFTRAGGGSGIIDPHMNKRVQPTYFAKTI